MPKRPASTSTTWSAPSPEVSPLSPNTSSFLTTVILVLSLASVVTAGSALTTAPTRVAQRSTARVQEACGPDAWPYHRLTTEGVLIPRKQLSSPTRRTPSPSATCRSRMGRIRTTRRSTSRRPSHSTRGTFSWSSSSRSSCCCASPREGAAAVAPPPRRTSLRLRAAIRAATRTRARRLSYRHRVRAVAPAGTRSRGGTGRSGWTRSAWCHYTSRSILRP